MITLSIFVMGKTIHTTRYKLSLQIIYLYYNTTTIFKSKILNNKYRLAENENASCRNQYGILSLTTMPSSLLLFCA